MTLFPGVFHANFQISHAAMILASVGRMKRRIPFKTNVFLNHLPNRVEAESNFIHTASGERGGRIGGRGGEDTICRLWTLDRDRHSSFFHPTMSVSHSSSVLICSRRRVPASTLSAIA